MKRTKQHMWMSWDGRPINSKARCVTCHVIRERYTSQTVYYKDGLKLNEIPNCKA